MNTQNLNEIKHFESLSPNWWDERGPFRLLHAMTPLRMTFLKEKIKLSFPVPATPFPPLKTLRILDVGCGGGLLCEPLSRLGAEVTGIDPVEGNILTARRHGKERGISVTYLSCAIEDLPTEIPPFDIIIASEVLEHVENPEEFLEACTHRLKAKGALFLSTLNKTLTSYLLGIVAAEYVLKWAPLGTHSWEKFIPPHTLSSKLRQLGFSYQEVQGVAYSPLRQKWSFSPSLKMNYFLWAKR